jgi:hypothetical protein
VQGGSKNRPGNKMKAGIVQQIFNDHFDDYRKGRILFQVAFKLI